MRKLARMCCLGLRKLQRADMGTYSNFLSRLLNLGPLLAKLVLRQKKFSVAMSLKIRSSEGLIVKSHLRNQATKAGQSMKSHLNVFMTSQRMKDVILESLSQKWARMVMIEELKLLQVDLQILALMQTQVVCSKLLRKWLEWPSTMMFTSLAQVHLQQAITL